MLRYKASPRALLTNSAIISPPPSLRLGSQREGSSGNKKQKHQSPPSAAFSSQLHFSLASPPFLPPSGPSNPPLSSSSSPVSAAPASSPGAGSHRAPHALRRRAASGVRAPRPPADAQGWSFARLVAATLTHGSAGRPRCGVGLGEGGRVRGGGRGTGPSRALGPAGGRERERRAAGRDKANRLPSPPPGRTAPMPLGQTPAATAAAAHSLFISSPPGPSSLSSEVRSGGWSLQKLPRGVLGAVPPRLRGQPSIPGSPSPFPHPDPPPKVPPTLPPRLEAPPTLSPGGRLRLPTSRPPPVSLTFDFSLGSRGDPGATAGKQPKEVAGVRPGRGRNETGRTRSLAPLLPGGAWHQRDLNPGRCVCQAMPGVSPVSWRDFWGPGEEEQVWLVLQTWSPRTHTQRVRHPHCAGAEMGWIVGVGEFEGAS